MDDGLHTFGFKGEFAGFLLNHPWLVMSSALVLVGFITFIAAGEQPQKFILAMRILVPIFVISTAFVRYVHREGCYKVTIDPKNDAIVFHRLFNRGIEPQNLFDITVSIDRNIYLIAKGRRYKIFNEFFYDVASQLPENIKIEFKGFFGRLFEKELIKTKRKFSFWPKDRSDPPKKS